MNWYERLADYFPMNELKTPEHLEDLLDHHEAYHKWETDRFVVTYAEFRTFIFIDYLLVNASRRGAGLGSKIIDHFKRRQKLIILEVEPANREDPDTARRIAFYRKNGFQAAEAINYTRSDDDGTPYTMDVYYWSPEEIPERLVYEKMRTICREIHSFRSLRHYGRIVADPEEVLDWDPEVPVPAERTATD